MDVHGWAHRIGFVASVVACACNPDARQQFTELAMPVLESRCASAQCHGLALAEPTPGSGLYFRLDGDGHIADPVAARQSALGRVYAGGAPELSSLLRVPMPPEQGGGPHSGGVALGGVEDPAFAALAEWIASESSGGEDIELDPLERTFADTVHPFLVERCGQSGCHGPRDGAFASFSAQPAADGESFAPAQLRRAYQSARKHLDLWSDDPMRSRLIRKGMRVPVGGLAHRRARFGFFVLDGPQPRDASAIQAIIGWTIQERQALALSEDRTVHGLLYIAGPMAPRDPYRIRTQTTGSALMLATWPPEGQGENLSAPLHVGISAEVRDPALSHDAKRVTFALRAQTARQFRLWELDLVTRTYRRVVSPEVAGSFVQPVYAPDGRIIAVWDGHGEIGVDAEGIAPELVAITGDGQIERLTYTPAPEVAPSFLASGKTRGSLLFSTRRRGERGTEGLMFRFPLCHDPGHHADPEYHAHYGASIWPMAPLGGRDLADGRQVFVALSGADAHDDRGMLGVLDRSLGPMLADADIRSASLMNYTPAVTWLDRAPRYRDPAPLPDGQILAAMDGPDHPGKDHIVVIQPGLGEDSSIVVRELLADAQLSFRSPIPVFTRPPEDDEHAPVTDPGAPRATLSFRDAGLLSAIYGRTEPIGTRTPLSSIAAVRVLAWDATSATRWRVQGDGGSTTGLTTHRPTRILGQWPVADDRSLALDVPARTPLMLQWLDHRGMQVGRQLDRWYYAEGREVVTGGTNPASYDAACAGCHGSASGIPNDELTPPPDAISAASITLSTHVNRDPKLARAAIVVPEIGERIDFRSSIGPMLRDHCGDGQCHGSSAPAASLPLDDRPGTGRFPAAYERLVHDQLDSTTGLARKSRLINYLRTPGPGDCPPPGLPGELIDALIAWIETGSLYDHDAIEGDIRDDH